MKQKTRNEKRLTIKKRVKYAQTAPAAGGRQKESNDTRTNWSGMATAAADCVRGVINWLVRLVGRNAPWALFVGKNFMAVTIINNNNNTRKENRKKNIKKRKAEKLNKDWKFD